MKHRRLVQDIVCIGYSGKIGLFIYVKTHQTPEVRTIGQEVRTVAGRGSGAFGLLNLEGSRVGV